MSMKNLGHQADAGQNELSTDVIADPRPRPAVIAHVSGGFEIVIDTRLGCITTDGRLASANRVIQRACRQSGALCAQNDEHCATVRMERVGKAEAQKFAHRLQKKVDRVLRAPLTPKMVDRALGITKKERRRWYKDGRLPTCGRGVIGCGNHKIHYPLFHERYRATGKRSRCD